MKRAFTVIELVIVVAVMGIVAAIVLPTVQQHITKSKAASAKETLHVLRNTIEVYAAQHNGIPPGYPKDNLDFSPDSPIFWKQMFEYEQRLSQMPENPFNELYEIRIVLDAEPFPGQPISPDLYGWVYKPATKTIRLNTPGTDSSDIRYFDY